MRHSSNVTICLIIAGVEHEVAQVANGRFFLREPVDIEPASTGEIVVTIDGEATRERVFLPNGVQKTDKQALYLQPAS